MSKSDLWALMEMKQPEIAARFPVTRRFFANNFVPDPRFHRDGKVALTSVNQMLLVDVRTGEFEPIKVEEELPCFVAA